MAGTRSSITRRRKGRHSLTELSIDIETFSPLSLRDYGLYRYAGSLEFSLQLFGYAFDDEPATVVDIENGEELPLRVMEALYDPDVRKYAFNANFERVCLSNHFRKAGPLPPEQWHCTAVLCREYGLPGSLQDAGAVLGLPQAEQKQKEGKELVKFFSLPMKAFKTRGYRTRNRREDAPGKWELYKDYNRQDVESERAVRRKLPPLNEAEQYLYTVDLRINDRGVKVDVPFAERAIQLGEEDLIKQGKKMTALTGMTSPRSVIQLKRWLAENADGPIESLNRAKLPDLIEQYEGTDVGEALALRGELTKTSIKKYEVMLRIKNDDDRVQGLSVFYGAGRTGRWAGRLLQLQNFPRPSLDETALDEARAAVMDGDTETLENIAGTVSSALSQLTRSALIPEDGHTFVVVDYSAIEARVLAWLAGEEWRLDVFRKHGRIYEASAERMFGRPEGSVTHADPLRRLGKLAELGLGYGGSKGALIGTGALSMGLKEEELMPLVEKWRAANPRICALWRKTQRAIQDALDQAPYSFPISGGCVVNVQNHCLYIKLPSGRYLCYQNPRMNNGELLFDAPPKGGSGWIEQRAFGAKIVENISQAIARDCLARSIVFMEKKDWPVVFHVHDELICEVKDEEAEQALQALLDRIAEPVPWAKGLPLKGDGFLCKHYRKG